MDDPGTVHVHLGASAWARETPTPEVPGAAHEVTDADARRSPRTGPGTLLNIAHRGASGRAPENTLTALAAAVADGADLLEFDVRRTRDGALVLMHDPTLTRTTDARRVFPGRAPWLVERLQPRGAQAPPRRRHPGRGARR